MELHERIKELRKNYLHMSQTEFGKQLGVSRSVINNMERNCLARPDQKLSLLKLMCTEFNISEDWLLNGTGDMFSNLPEEDEYFKAATQLSDDQDVRSVLIAYWKQDDVGKKALKKFMKDIFTEIQKQKNTESSKQ